MVEEFGRSLPPLPPLTAAREPDVLVTKVTIPQVCPVLLPREQLFTALDQSRSFPLTLLSASTGFGKTTLLAAWASQRANQAPTSRGSHWMPQTTTQRASGRM